jgi:hypothetical protein
MGFFIGILIDSPSSAYFRSPGPDTAPTTKSPSIIGVVFGLVSTVSTALHAVVIKRSLDAVGGSTLQLAWYSNLVSAFVMLPMVFLAGELPGIMDLLFGAATPDADNGFSALATFIWGSAITVRPSHSTPRSRPRLLIGMAFLGMCRISHLYCRLLEHQDHVPHYTHGQISNRINHCQVM